MKPAHDFADFSVRQKELDHYSQTFILHPKHLQSFVTTAKLDWHHIRFQKANISQVPAEAGVYTFAVNHDGSGLPPHGYVLYVGQTGGKRNDRTLRDRAREYFREKAGGKRLHVWWFLNKWDGCVIFSFVPLNPKAINLLQIESKLNDALMPPYSIKDFSPEIRARKKLWGMS